MFIKTFSIFFSYKNITLDEYANMYCFKIHIHTHTPRSIAIFSVFNKNVLSVVYLLKFSVGLRHLCFSGATFVKKYVSVRCVVLSAFSDTCVLR